MTYDGTMVMPSRCTLMDEEEMTYVEGGGTITVVCSVDFLKDCITASTSAVVSIICAGIGIAVGGPIGGAVGKTAGSVIGAAVGAALGWIIGGSISRNSIKKSISFDVDIPILNSRTLTL